MRDHEQALLEAILRDSLVIDRHNVVSAMFCESASRGIFEAMLKTRGTSAALDLISLADSLREMGRDDLVIEASRLSPDTAANAGYYAKKLRAGMRRRELAPIVREAVRSIDDPNSDIEEIIKGLSDGLVESWKCAREEEDPSIEMGIPAYVEELKRRKSDDGTTGARFGIDSLDGALGSNIGAGELVAIAARPSVGKTALALQMAVYNATRRGIPATIFSLEMTRNEVYDRLFAPAMPGGIQSLRMGVIRDSRAGGAMMNLSRDLHESGFRVFESSMSPDALASHIRRDALVYKTRLFVVDYLGLLDFGGDGKRARWEIVGDCTKMLKRLALDLAVSIIICVQLGRDADGREPMLSDLRDSGSIEQDCNRVILLHRPDDKNPASDYPCDAIIPKNRGGARGRVHLFFVGNKTKFEMADTRREG